MIQAAISPHSRAFTAPPTIELERRAKALRAQHLDWAKVSNPDVEIFFVIWGALPFPIDIAPAR